MITGNTSLIAHIGYPTHSFKAPMIYNPYFEQEGIDSVVVPMGCRAEHFADLLRAVFNLTNITGALITMPHKIAAAQLLDESSPAVRIAGACNAVRRAPDGRLIGDLFDGEGFVRGLLRNGCHLAGARALVVGTGGVGSAIAASLAAAGVASIALHDLDPQLASRLAGRLRAHYPALAISLRSNAPEGCDLVVNCTPLGMNDGDPLPVDVARIPTSAFVGEVVMTRTTTAFLAAASAHGCRVQAGTEMLFEQIPAYLEFFGLTSTTPDTLRALARLGNQE